MVRNPWPLLLNLALPLAITALIGLAFGGGGSGGSVARIRVAVVDEDGSFLGGMFKSALTQGEASEHFEIITPKRDEAVRLLRDDKISAALIVPANFTKDYLTGKQGLELEVIKNPAQSFYPAIVEELSSVAVTGLNAVSRNLQSEFPTIQAAFTNKFDFLELLGIVARLGDRAKNARDYLTPPLVTYKREVMAAEKKDESKPFMGVFAYVLPGMASAFLLFLADHAMRDIHREKRMKTLDRVRSITTGTGAFVISKVVYAALLVLLGGAILLSAGSIIFGISWGRPALMVWICIGYSIFAAGFLAALVALAPSERRSETINTMILFIFAFAGGSYFPANQLPAFMREHICPLIPNYWFIEAIRGLQSGEPGSIGAVLIVAKLAAAGAILAVLASAVLQRNLSQGARA